MNEIFLYDEIYGGFAQTFASRFADSVQQGDVEVRLNCVGGSIIEGLGVYNLLNSSSQPVTIIIDGVAASMGAIIALAGKPVKMRRNALMMLHKANFGYASGDAEDLRKSANELEMFEDVLVNIVATKTGMTVEEIKTNFFNGKENWLSAEECLSKKLIDEIIEEITPTDAKSGWKEIYNKVSSIKSKNHMTKPSFWARLGFTNQQPTEADIDGKVKELQDSITAKDNEINTLKQKVAGFEQSEQQRKAQEAEAKKTEIVNKVSDLIKTGRIKAEQKDSVTAMLTNDFENSLKFFENLPAGKSLTGATNADDARKDWKLSDYMKNDPKALAEIKKNNPDKYKALKDQHMSK